MRQIQPHGHGDFATGLKTDYHLTDSALGKAVLAYRGRGAPLGMRVDIECEVYEADGILMVHSACPKCRHSITIDGRNKRIEFDTRTGSLQVESFRCPWELDDESPMVSTMGMNLCGLELVYDGFEARDA